MPLKFLVTSVMSPAPGNESFIGYGSFMQLDPGLPSAKSQVGTRIRAVLRDAQGKRTVLSAELPSAVPAQFVLTSLGGTTLSVGMAPGTGIEFSGGTDIHPPGSHKLMVWSNPTLRVVRDAGGHVRGLWGWSGTCFLSTDPLACASPEVILLDLDQIDGSAPPSAYGQGFLRTLSPADRTTIASYDRLGSNPFTTETEMDADPRFSRLGEVDVDPLGSRLPNPVSWTPCPGVARDDDFPVLASTEVPISATETVIIEHSWLSTSVVCTTQSPGLNVGTSTAGCLYNSVAYLDRMFGTLSFLYVTSRPACTVP